VRSVKLSAFLVGIMAVGPAFAQSAPTTTKFRPIQQNLEQILDNGATITSATDGLLFMEQQPGNKWFACSVSPTNGQMDGTDSTPTMQSQCFSIN
jgi:hypothetical protein